MSELKTHAEIIGEMRFHGQQNINAEKDKREYGILTYEGRLHKNFADELAAAHKREIENLNSVIQTQSAALQQEYVKHEQEVANLRRRIGDTARLRGALVSAIGTLKKLYAPSKRTAGRIVTCRQKCEAALAAPARECDVGTPAEQAQRMADFCKRHYKKAVPGRHICSACKFHNKDVEWECYFAWAQMPYRESGVSK